MDRVKLAKKVKEELDKKEAKFTLNYEESDQAGLINDIFSIHLKSHGGKPDPECEFCQGFIIYNGPKEPLSNFKFIILDLNDNSKDSSGLDKLAGPEDSNPSPDISPVHP